MHFSNSCKSLASCSNEQVVHLSLYLSPSLSHTSPPCSLSPPIDKSKWANTESLHLRFRPSITATYHNSLNSNTVYHCREQVQHAERKEVKSALLPLRPGAWFTVRRPAWPIENSYLALTRVVNRNDTALVRQHSIWHFSEELTFCMFPKTKWELIRCKNSPNVMCKEKPASVEKSMQ